MHEVNYDEMINRNPFKPTEGHLEIGPGGHLVFAGYDTVELAEKYGTPLFVFSEEKLRENYRMIKAALAPRFRRFGICFALKSNSLLGVLAVMQSEGAFADVVSEVEFRKAVEAGFDPVRIVFNGNNKSLEELRLAIGSGALINCDSAQELEMIKEEAGKLGKKARVSIRVNCDVDSGVIPEFSTAVKSSKFGIDLDGGAFEAYRDAYASEHCSVEGIHSHLGSQIENRECYKYAAEKIMDFCGRLKRELGLELRYVNMGGGFAIPFEYLDEYDTVDSFAEAIAEIVGRKVKEQGLAEPELLVEPGGSLAGTSAIALFRVGTIKEKENLTLAAIDAGGDALLRATQGWYSYRVIAAGKADEPPAGRYNIVGPLCYEGDAPARGRDMPRLETGDVLAFIDTGAYTTTLFNNYNGRLNPLILMISPDGPRIIKERQTYEDLVRGERL